MGFISVKQYTPKLQVLSMFFGSKNQTKKEALSSTRLLSALYRIRTCGLSVRSRTLYPLS